MIWSDLLPALEFFNEVTLPLSTSRVVDGVATELPLTLTDLLVGIFVLLVTFLAAKNLPGILEITLLQRLPLDPGARYAFTTLVQYLIVGIGLIIAFTNIGFQWSSIQWLVAALGVGLGFGLQEIVANFISGIILLFERPIRVGDVVTLDDTTGVVSRIRIRATTVMNYDKQELLIPNKEFITGRVINWTLSDKVNRLMIHVGVAYGSDVTQAMSLMLEAANENENVLKEPNPMATFEAFGDNTLNLVLRAYLGNMDNRLSTITALHEAINRKFSDAGISIAFPQRDLHLDTTQPLDIRIFQDTDGLSRS
jgi:potassium efflux system protein